MHLQTASDHQGVSTDAIGALRLSEPHRGGWRLQANSYQDAVHLRAPLSREHLPGRIRPSDHARPGQTPKNAPSQRGKHRPGHGPAVFPPPDGKVAPRDTEGRRAKQGGEAPISTSDGSEGETGKGQEGGDDETD